MDLFDREKYAAAYRLLADVLEREPAADAEETHVPFILGDLARRVFVGSQFEPPDELLEQVAHILRSTDLEGRQHMAHRLRENAEHLDTWQYHAAEEDLPPPAASSEDI